MATSPYAVLGVSSRATSAEIRAAYRALAKVHHPDVAGPAAEARFIALRAAYDVLIDPVRRAAHDRAPEVGLTDEDLAAALRRRRTERRRQRLMKLY